MICDKEKIIKLTSLVFVLTMLGACGTARLNTLDSIGSDDLTSKKPINILVYTKQNKSNEIVLKNASNSLFREARKFSQQEKISLNSTGVSPGDWKDIAEDYFHEDEYNWIFEQRNKKYPEIAFQNFSDDIDSSREVHYRFCQLRTIQFANIKKETLSNDLEYWQSEMYSAAINGIYLLFKGNSSMDTQKFNTIEGRSLAGSILGGTEKYTFVLVGETNLYIFPKTQ